LTVLSQPHKTLANHSGAACPRSSASTNTFSWNQFWDVTIPVVLERGTNTIRFIANQQYNYDGHTVGVIYSGSNGVGAALRASTAPNIDQISIAPRQVAVPS